MIEDGTGDASLEASFFANSVPKGRSILCLVDSGVVDILVPNTLRKFVSHRENDK